MKMNDFQAESAQFISDYEQQQEAQEVEKLRRKIDNAKSILETFGPEELIKSKEWDIQEQFREVKQSIFFFETLLRVRQWDVSQLNVPVNKVVKISIRSLTKELESKFPGQEFFRAFQSRFTIIPVVLMSESDYLDGVNDCQARTDILWRTNKNFNSPRQNDLVAVPYNTPFNRSLKHWNWAIDTWD